MKIILIGIGIFAAVLSFGLYCCILSGAQEDRRLEDCTGKVRMMEKRQADNHRKEGDDHAG